MYYIDNNIFSFFLFGIICIFFVFVLLGIMFFLSTKNYEHEKILPYECGFEEFSSSRNLLDIHYYIIAILFLLFDIETVYLIPWCLNVILLDWVGFVVMFIFILLLLIGFVFEWSKGSLNWMNYE